MRRAQDLDRTGVAIDYEIAAIDREAAEALLLQKYLSAELPMIGGYDEPALNEFQRRVIRHEELARKFQTEFPLYQNKTKRLRHFGRRIRAHLREPLPPQ